MGAWGTKTFENDDASDWLYDLEGSSDLSVIKSALEESNSEYIEAPEGCNILAAAEIILALSGQSCVGLPENAAEWVSKNKSLNVSGLKSSACEAVESVMSDNSELKELWEETEYYESWLSDVQAIKAALG